MRLDGLVECFVAIPRVVLAPRLVKGPQEGRQDPDPVPLSPDFADLLARHWVFPHERRHSRYQHDPLRHIPTPQHLQVEVICEAMQHSSEVLSVEWRQDQQVGPRAVLGDGGFEDVRMLPGRRGVLVDMVGVPDRLELRGDGGVSGRGKALAGNDLQSDMAQAVEARDNGAAKAKGSRVGEGDENVQRMLGGLRSHESVRGGWPRERGKVTHGRLLCWTAIGCAPPAGCMRGYLICCTAPQPYARNERPGHDVEEQSGDVKGRQSGPDEARRDRPDGAPASVTWPPCLCGPGRPDTLQPEAAGLSSARPAQSQCRGALLLRRATLAAAVRCALDATCSRRTTQGS